MKRIITLILILILGISLIACGDNNTDTDTNVGTGNGGTGVIYDTMKRFNCKDNTGYDKSIKEDNGNWIARHSGVELGNLELYGCVRDGDGYRIVNVDELAIKYKVKQNLGSLVSHDGTKNGAESLWVNNDSSVGVVDTSIDTTVGIGAYYVKIKYTDGTESDVSKTDFFKDAQNGMTLNMISKNSIDTDKVIASIDVTVVYESYAGAPGVLGVWWHEYTNWRCEYTYNF